MAAEILKLIESTLKGLPKDHPEREFWELQQQAFGRLMRRRLRREAARERPPEVSSEAPFAFNEEQREWLRANSYRVVDIKDLSIDDVVNRGLYIYEADLKGIGQLRASVSQVAVRPSDIIIFPNRMDNYPDRDKQLVEFSDFIGMEIGGLSAKRADLCTYLQLELWFQQNDPALLFSNSIRLVTSSQGSESNSYVLDRGRNRKVGHKMKVFNIGGAILTGDLPVIYRAN